MLENYTDRAKDLMSDAQNILRRYKHSQLDTEHLLVAMLEDTDGIVTKLLGHLNTDITAVKRVIETNLASTSRTQSSGGREQQIYITPRMKRILDISDPTKPVEVGRWWYPGTREGDEAPPPPRLPKQWSRWRKSSLIQGLHA